jgi:DUF4097 and DUF4098 domain-containing protein YvlB
MDGATPVHTEFHVHAAHVDDQDVPRSAGTAAFLFASHRRILPAINAFDHRRAREAVASRGANHRLISHIQPALLGSHERQARMIQRQSLVVVLTLLSVSAVWSVARATETSKVTGSIDIAPGEHTGDLSTVNGSIRVGQNAVVGHAHTVNGGISLERHASANGLKTVNGSIELAEAVRVRGDVHSVNGKLILENGADVSGQLKNVNGLIRVAAAHVGGGIDTVTGGIELGPDARVDGEIHVRKDTSGSDSGNIPRVVVGPGSVVGGALTFERPVKLYVSDKAKIGRVEGATAVRYPGDRPPG